MPENTTLEMLEMLVSHNTVSHVSNLPLISDLEAYLVELGVKPRLVHSPCGKKANLFATIGPADRPGIILSGHVDVVPVEGQNWTSDPFKLREANGRYYGRGTTDMKGFDAVFLAKVPAMLSADLHHPVHVVLSYDEEVTCLGAKSMLEQLRDEGFQALGCIVGEPTSMQTVIAHKTSRVSIARLKGLECHSSLAPQGVNAVEYAARLASYVSDMGREFAISGRRDPHYDVEHSTAHVGKLHGGTAANIVANEAELCFELRTIADDDIDQASQRIVAFAKDELEPQMKAVCPECGIEIEEISTVVGIDTEKDAPISCLSRKLAGIGSVAKVAFGTEGGLFQKLLGVPTVICGPGRIEQAHKPDEYIEGSQLEACECYMDGLIDRLKTAFP